MANYKLYFDGSCSPQNPGGTAKYGFALFKYGQREPIVMDHGIIGTGPGMTNNLAEFTALWHGLMAFYLQVRDDPRGSMLICVGDSRLVVNVMNNKWGTDPSKPYYPSYDSANKLYHSLEKSGHLVGFKWIPREQNQMADDLSKIK
jgi:ribonuclease HI